MTKAPADARARSQISQVALIVLLGATACGSAACSLSSPRPAEYVLGATPAAKMDTLAQTGFPVVEVKRIQLPDYLDTTDILERRGNQLVPSSTGRWGERLSVGMTRALTASLAARLPHMVVTATPPVGRPARQILIDVASFELRSDRQVVLVARWTIADGADYRALAAKQVSLVEAVAATDDGAVVAAMSQIIENLAAGLADGIKSSRRAGTVSFQPASARRQAANARSVITDRGLSYRVMFRDSGNICAVYCAEHPLRYRLDRS